MTSATKLKRRGCLTTWIGITSNALLPFAFGCFAAREAYLAAPASPWFFCCCLYPITLEQAGVFHAAVAVASRLLSKIFRSQD